MILAPGPQLGYYHDDNQTLSPETQDLFEAEANFFAGK
jgi:hypothetical protein